jgi:CRISPR-associated protein Cas1
VAWRGLHLSEPARLTLRDRRLVVAREEKPEVAVPVEDLDYVVLDTGRVTLTAALLGALAGCGCLVVTTDSRHLPNGSLLPFHAYHRQGETIQAQLAVSEPRRKRLWQAIVQAKIRNQAECLRRLGKPDAAQGLDVLVQKVKSGDRDNQEAVAARRYWQTCLDGFSRRPGAEDRENGLLNYGYAIVRSVLARHLAAYGFWPSLGLHHRNVQNPFNLADDLMEPLRPVVDREAFRILSESPEKEELDVQDRRAMSAVLHASVRLGEEEHIVLEVSRRLVEHVRAWCMAKGDAPVPLPEFPDRGEAE